MPLAETTTSHVVLKKGEVAKRQSEAAEKKLLCSGYLDEKRVPFPGDRDGFELNWLGNAPFMQAQVDTSCLRSSRPYAADRDQDHRTSEQNYLQALALHVKLSDKTFLSGFNGKIHLKIEVLFNGQLSTCSLTHTNDIRSGAKSLHQIFAGYRVDFLAERPWVLLPPFTTADGGTRRFRKTIMPQQRWEEISAAILKEAEDRGTNQSGESPPSATFLHALAGMEMPEGVKPMQKPGGRKFGVVDVLITAGYGNKLTTGTNYLKRPQRLRDSNYAVRTEISSDDEAAAAEPDHSQDTTDKIVNETEADVTSNEANAGESDALDERPRKRRALTSVRWLTQLSPKKTDFQSPLLSGQIPILPPSVPHTIPSSLSTTADLVTPRCPSSEHRSGDHKEPLPANDHRSTHSMTYEGNNMGEWKNNASRIYQENHCLPPQPVMHALHAGSEHPTLTSLSPSKGSNTHGLNGVSPFVRSALITSPVPHIRGYHASPPARPTHFDRIGALDATTTLGPSTPFMAPTTLMLPTHSNWSAPLSATSPPYHHFMSSQQPPQFGPYSYPPIFPPYMPPNALTDPLPHTHPLHTYSGPTQFTTPVVPSPPLFQPCGQSPPTAMFSVPSMPRRSLSPDKGAATSGLHVSPNSVTVSRLVVTGHNGKPIVDHVWRTPQRILLTTTGGSDTLAEGRAKPPVLPLRKSLADHRAYERNSPPNRSPPTSSQATSAIKRPRKESNERRTGERRRDSAVEPAIGVPLPYLKRHQGPTNETPPVNPKIDVPDKIAPFVPAHVLAMTTPTLVPTPMHTPRSASSTRPTILQRRTFSRNALPSIQGPKAATFLFDDPEEVLREAARMRRSRSPTKPAATLPVPQTTLAAQDKLDADEETQESSSPLSSAPSSPLSDKRADVANIADAASDQLPQIDGPSERTLPPISPHKLHTPSATKPAFAAPKLQRSGSASPQSSISPRSKKRKSSHQAPTKPPRSPDRLKTVYNPPLNGDCVIAFAESVDKKEERGILRQVKGERQGVFREEYVVLAVRFFVAGD
ncbi:hypothetical protein E8E12_000807 [Didymella heteroderae]|uniref:Uncharacterized protein n=1 Tax=Didymella heteroderae TaxID=1769908 RepID=A0A9P4WGU8_9PLEO|nr:hypothetical protein E8E12_000807 [Didymella heteroderae]